MSSNHLMYDTCAYKKALDQSTGPLRYAMYPGKYNHCRKCRMELGIVGGNAVSIYKGNLVDLESDLRGQTRPASKCPSHKYHPWCKKDDCKNGLPSGPMDCDAMLQHQPSCQMIRYKPLVLPPRLDVAFCPEYYQNQPKVSGNGSSSCPQNPSGCSSCPSYEYQTLPYPQQPQRPSCPPPRPAPYPDLCDTCGVGKRCQCAQAGRPCNCGFPCGCN